MKCLFQSIVVKSRNKNMDENIIIKYIHLNYYINYK